MLTNAVSSAVGRLYAGATAVEPRLSVQRIEAIVRLAKASASAAPEHDGDRGHAAQRAALTKGVREVFESVSSSDSVLGALSDSPGASSAADANGRSAQAATAATPDPHLEASILRFIHAVFRSVAEAEAGPGDDSALEVDTLLGHSVGIDVTRSAYPAFSRSREVLGGRIEALADRLQADGSEFDRLVDDDGSSGDPAGELNQSFADVLRSLGVTLAGATSADGRPAQPTRGDLVGLMHKLAHAMQGAPPISEGLPTVGGLLHARA